MHAPFFFFFLGGGVCPRGSCFDCFLYLLILEGIIGKKEKIPKLKQNRISYGFLFFSFSFLSPHARTHARSFAYSQSQPNHHIEHTHTHTHPLPRINAHNSFASPCLLYQAWSKTTEPTHTPSLAPLASTPSLSEIKEEEKNTNKPSKAPQRKGGGKKRKEKRREKKKRQVASFFQRKHYTKCNTYNA
ncbi:hypothetical protein BD289DRAFT_120816 [Coniella lustricola]|uniref:Uncharacterized protein n=1 Tax=Coniella lustricola TaxID=2025994 RepID=A0A2T2ZWR5_9PEZI|nr:hypothetical protein BD289DRAFT_120816 [Coniella lustricola]